MHHHATSQQAQFPEHGREKLVELDRQLENDYLRLDNGIQDQTTISYARQGWLVHMDSRTRVVDLVQDAPSFDSCRIIIAYSGYSRELTSTGFNVRVQECWQHDAT